MAENTIGSTTRSPATAFDLTGRVAVITGSAGLLGRDHAAALREAGATVVGLDLVAGSGDDLQVDITDPAAVAGSLDEVLRLHGRVDILINNAAHNPKVEDGDGAGWSRFETYDRGRWDAELAVGLTGAFLVSQVFGAQMARSGGGVILNVCSDLAVIAPDQRLYRKPGLSLDEQPVKPVTYSVVKAGLLGLTRYLATYWAEQGVRVNAISPGGVENGQSAEFVARLSSLVPMGRMARPGEYGAAVLFLCSDASAYLNGHNLVVDGGRTCW